MRCIKCGSEDVSITYHSDIYDCLFCDRNRKEGEHLHIYCKVCFYDWCEDTLDKKGGKE